MEFYDEQLEEQSAPWWRIWVVIVTNVMNMKDCMGIEHCDV